MINQSVRCRVLLNKIKTAMANSVNIAMYDNSFAKTSSGKNSETYKYTGFSLALPSQLSINAPDHQSGSKNLFMDAPKYTKLS